MLIPKQTKFRKYQKGCLKGIKQNTTFLKFGKYGIKSLETARIPTKTIEALRRVMTRKFKRSGQIWIRIYPDIPITSKPAEVRMGKGKGSVSYWICRVKKGQILFEMDKIPYTLAKQAAILVFNKLPIQAKFIMEKD